MSTIAESHLSNKDLAPTGPEQRTWGAYHLAALWIGLSIVIITYTLAAGLVAAGMTWWQGLLTVALGNLIVLVPILLNSHPGTKYGIPFPVLVRSSFGIRGANVAAMARALVACGWFGIQTWIGALIVADPTFFDELYKYGVFVAFGLSAISYVLLMRAAQRPATAPAPAVE